ncbi:CHAT domain-containing tetratricopeptide repeat protein [Nonomuraea insulae]|uniref:CHAT domain-containing protein n=1 Tax=Nonomuraea insulae TaxID=1616787 RepID=A0ABW1D7E8_9ACTN
MTDPAGALAARIERFEQDADPELIWDPAALSEAEQAMRACAGDRSDAGTWRLIGMLHLARYRLDQQTTQDAAVAGAFFAAVAVVDPGRLPEKLRGGAGRPRGESADTWAGLLEEVLRHVDPGAYPHVGLLIHALVRRAIAHPTQEVADRLGQFLLEQSMRAPDPSWASGALGSLGSGLVRLHGLNGDRDALDDAVHVLLRAELYEPGPHAGELAAALALAAPDDEELVRAYLAAAEAPPGGQDRSRALLTLVDRTQARAAASCADEDLLAFIRAGQCALDFWHEEWAHPGVLAPYAAGLIEWYVVTGNESSLEAGLEMLEALHVTPDETARGLGADPLVRLGLLGERRWRRYGVTGSLTDLDAAVDVMREATALAPDGHPDRARLLAHLANALLRRAVVTGGPPAEPVATARAALTAHGGHDPGTLLLLAQALTLDLTPPAADEAVAALREALSVGERPAFQAEAYGLLSDVLRRRAAWGERRGDDLDEAVAAARQGIELAMKAARDQGAAQRVLCRALLARHSARGDIRDLTEALSLAGDVNGGSPESGNAVPLPELGAVLDAMLGAEPDTSLDPGPGSGLSSGLDPGLGSGLGSGLNSRPDSGLDSGLDSGAVDEQLALAATELALRVPDEEMALKLLRVAERRAGERGEFLLGVALRLTEAGRAHLAVTVLERAAGAFEGAGLGARAAYTLSRLGAVHEDLGRLSRALEVYARAATLHHELNDPRSEARQLGNMGLVHLRTGAPGRAAELHLRAIALCESAGLAAEEAAHQAHAAEAYLAAGDPATAVACAGRARDLRLSLGEPVPAALALVPAARAAVDLDDLSAAADRMAACAIELEAAGAWEEACRALDAHAALLAERGHGGRAAACETRLVEIVRRRGRRREPADEWYRIAQRRRFRGDADGALVAFELAEREYESIGHHDGAGSVRYNLGVLAYGEGEPERALEAFGAAVETFAGLRAAAKEATALTMRASCLTALGRMEEALADLDRALELAAAAGDLEALLTATLGRAAVDVEVGNLQEAEERLYSALGLAGGDALKEAVVRDRLAALAARTGDLAAQAESMEASRAGFHRAGQYGLAALASIKLGFTLEARGEFRRARAALEEGLTALERDLPDPKRDFPDQEGSHAGQGGSRAGQEAARSSLAEAPFEIVAAMTGDLDAAVLSRLAAIQLTLGDITRGRATLAQAAAALRAGGRRKETAQRLESWLRLEETESAGDWETARTLAEQALTALTPAEQALTAHHRPATNTADRSYLLAKLSSFCHSLGDYPAAYGYAARGYELRDDRVIEHLRNLGAAATALGRPEEATGHLTKAVELARDADTSLPVQLALSLGLLAAALTDLARWPEAARAYEEGLALIEAPIWRALRAPLLTGRATLHLKLGELDEAATRYRQAISIGEELGRHRGLAAAYADLGLIHELRGEFTQARPLVERALDLERTPGRGRVLALIALSRLTETEEPVRAAMRLEEALAVAQEIGFRAGEAVALSRLGALDLTTAAYDRARHRLSTAIDLLTDLGHDLELATACHHRSRAAEELGDLPAALADTERAHVLSGDQIPFRAVRGDQAPFRAAGGGQVLGRAVGGEQTPGHAAGGEQTPGRAVAGDQVPDLAVLGGEQVLDRAIRLAVRLNRGMTAWRHAEHAKLSALTAHLDRRQRPAPHGVPEDLLEAERHALDTVRTLMSAARNTRDPEHAALLISRAHTAQADLDALLRRMEPLAPDHVALRRATPPSRAQLDALVSTPDHSAGAKALLGFHIGGGGITNGRAATGETAVTGEGAVTGRRTVTSEGEGTVTVLVHRTGWPEPRAFATTVDRTLLADFLDTTTARRPDLLDIETRRRRAAVWRRLADGLLSDALEALGDDIAQLTLLPHADLHRIPIHALAPAGRPLLERFPVTYAPSATILESLTRRPPAQGRGSLVLGFPWTDEAEDVAALLGTHPHTGRQATSDLLPGSWDVVHLACHAVLDQADPFGSGIGLADGLLTARDLMSMSLDAGLVLLTACERSAGDVAALGHGLLHAGARSAVLTLWPVSPEITRALMRDFHTRLSSGAGHASAFRAAVLDLRELYGSAEPELWASYVLVGLPGDDSPAHGEPGMSVTSTR